MARLDLTLTIGSKSDSITFLGSAPLLNTADAAVSTLSGNRGPPSRISLPQLSSLKPSTCKLPLP